MLKRITAFNFRKFFQVRFSSNVSQLEFDTNYYCDINNTKEIQHNISIRKGVGNINKVVELFNLFKATSEVETQNNIKEKLICEFLSLPNRTHPNIKSCTEPIVKHLINSKKEFGHKPLEFSEITQKLNLMRTEKLGNTCGHKSYYFLGELAELEEALLKYTVTKLLNENFKLVSVPDILPKNVLESCGMAVGGDRTQVHFIYFLFHRCSIILLSPKHFNV